MNESQFLLLVDTILTSIERQVDRWFDELDIELEVARNGNVVSITFENDSQVIINSQAPLQEIWVAAKRGGFHYRLVDGHWKDTRTEQELGQALSEICSEQSGHTLSVTIT